MRGPTQKAVAAALKGRSAIVTRAEHSSVVVFEEESDEQNQEVIAELGSRLLGELACPVLAVLNHDDDILWYQLYVKGELADEYDSNPLTSMTKLSPQDRRVATQRYCVPLLAAGA